ncbi:MAG: hypothetical protein ABIJ84_04450 [bacterium]
MVTEIEFRGPLTQIEFDKLLIFLRKEADFVKRMKRKTFVFETKDKTLDLKARTTDGVDEIVLKKGFCGARRREEIVIPLKTKSIEEAIKLFSLLGYSKGIIAIRDNYIFNYKNIEFALVKCPNKYCFYEAELINNKAIKNPEKHIKEVLKSLDLQVWSEKEVYDFMMYCKKNIDEHFDYKNK